MNERRVRLRNHKHKKTRSSINFSWPIQSIFPDSGGAEGFTPSSLLSDSSPFQLPQHPLQQLSPISQALSSVISDSLPIRELQPEIDSGLFSSIFVAINKNTMLRCQNLDKFVCRIFLKNCLNTCLCSDSHQMRIRYLLRKWKRDSTKNYGRKDFIRYFGVNSKKPAIQNSKESSFWARRTLANIIRTRIKEEIYLNTHLCSKLKYARALKVIALRARNCELIKRSQMY